MRASIAILALLCATIGCQPIYGTTTCPAPPMMESVVLAGSKPAKLLATTVDSGTVTVSSGGYGIRGTLYERGRDYVVNARAGTIARTADSRIPDFATNVLYGRNDFDHSQFPGYGNLPFTVYVGYAAPLPHTLAKGSDQSALVAKTRAKLEAGGPFKLIAFGDSISAGGEASDESLRFQNRYAQYLAARFPRARITVDTTATGGDNTVNGLARLEEKVLSRRPDLVLIGFGMNDHNRPGVGGVEPEPFRANLQTMVNRIRERTGADVILLSTFPPNPKWAFGTHRMEQYAAATEAAAAASGAAYADVYSVWMNVLKRKDPESLLANNINHPNDFGHWLYFDALRAVGF